MPRRRPVAVSAIVAVTVAAVSLTPTPSGAQADPTGSASAAPSATGSAFPLNGVTSGSHTVTLITGDRLTLSGAGGRFTVAVDRMAARPDGEREPLIEVTSDPDAVYAIPDDAAPAVESGRLDRRLFDVKYLAENGYLDDRTKQLPVIVKYSASRSAASVKAAAQALPASTPTRQLTSIHGASLTVPKADADAFWATVRGKAPTSGRAQAHALGAGIAKVWLDGKARATLDVSVPLIGAPQAWANGHDGSGVKVAVLDTGVDATHPDLVGRIAASQSFVPGQEVADGQGHGTHVASTIAGTGAAGGGTYTGVAKGAQLLVGKVLGDSGTGQQSWIIDGMEWATANGAKVVSMSLGANPTDGTDALSQAVDDLTASTGALFVVAAGNDGPGAETISAPGAADAALTVAATDKADKLAGFSSRGPRIGGALKPDIAAPGVGIVAARAAGTGIGTPVDERYTSLNGTSMATPHVAGAAAILAQQHPDWKAGQLKAALMSTAKDDGFTVYEQGAGRVDVARVDRQQVFATTPSVDFGNLDPGQHPEPVSKQITYTNLGNTPVTLTLTRGLRQVGGDPIPEGAFTGEDTVAVPAGGTATTTVTLDVSPLSVGRYSGAVVAEDSTGQTVLTTPVGLDRQPPRVPLTIRVLNRAGQPATTEVINVTVSAVDVPNTGAVRVTQVGDGVFQAFVEPGTYSSKAVVDWVDPATSVVNRAYLTDPQIEVADDTEITLDARKAKEVTLRTPRPTAKHGQVITHVRSRWDDQLLTSLTLGTGLAFAQTPILVLPTERVDKGVFRFNVTRTLANPQVTMRVTGNDAFDLQLFHRGYADRGQRMAGPANPAWLPWPAMHRRVDLVDVGFARPEDLVGKNLKGKLAVMQWGDDRFGDTVNDPPDGDPDSAIWTDRVHALTEAGAIGYLAVSNPPAGWEQHRSFQAPTSFLFPGRADGAQNIDLPEVQIPRDQGKELIQRLRRGPVTVDLNSDPNIRYTEHVYPLYDQQIPESPHHVIDKSNEKAVATSNHGATSTTLRAGVGVFVSGLQGVGGSQHVLSAGPSRRTEYFGPVDPRVTLKKARFSSASPQAEGLSITAYPKAGDAAERWFAPVTAPGSINLGAAYDVQDPNGRTGWYYCTMCREGDLLVPLLFPAAYADSTSVNSSERVGGVRLFREDGQEIAPTQDVLGVPAFKLPPEPATYRMTDEQPDKNTSWTFRSASATKDDWMPGGVCIRRFLGGATDTCDQQPLVFLGYDLGTALRLDNTVAAGMQHQFTVFAHHASSRGHMPDIAGLKLWTSTDDGATWNPASVKRDSAGTFTVKASYPKLSATTGAVSIKAEAWDADGNRIKQTITRAFNLGDNQNAPQ